MTDRGMAGSSGTKATTAQKTSDELPVARRISTRSRMPLNRQRWALTWKMAAAIVRNTSRTPSDTKKVPVYASGHTRSNRAM